jgi:C-terminal processing protease CtpA/Prc
MASFRPSGARYDGLGIEPDVRVDLLATDFLEEGTDSVLEAALERIRE